jgi:hypothetical protein
MQGQGPSLSEGQPRQERLVEIVELLFNSSRDTCRQCQLTPQNGAECWRCITLPNHVSRAADSVGHSLDIACERVPVAARCCAGVRLGLTVDCDD